MNRIHLRLLVFVLLALTALISNQNVSAECERGLPIPLAGHPGNVFLAGDEVVISIPETTTQWRAIDVDGQRVGEGTVTETQEPLSLGKRDIGWYRIEFFDASGKRTGFTTAAVLARLQKPVPDNSPVCVDSATSWFARRYPDDEKAHQEILANLAALAGVNWIRDRISWGEVETRRGTFAEATRYDNAAELATKQGLKVLQVFHSTPGWAVDKALDKDDAYGRFPRDLRDHFRFCRAMASRFHGQVRAWEPWNEANIHVFGGHTIDEMCSLQKAAYLGFKAGDGEVCVCWNVYAGSGSPLHSQGVIANEAWPYFETYNIHSYSKPERYEQEYATAREACCGRPLWITECGTRLTAASDPPWGDLSPEEDQRQANFLARSYASSLFAGVQRHFFFILGNYIERGVQFGLLRHDHTPRPGYVALAAVGRFLAGAECLGRVSPTIYAFRAQPDGEERDVLVAWGDETPWSLSADLQVESVFDHLGRPRGKEPPTTLGPSATFVLMPAGESRKLQLERLSDRSPRREGHPSPVVLQLSMPAGMTRLGIQSHEIEPGKESELPLYVYNFRETPVSGKLVVEEAPSRWKVQLPKDPIQVDPLGRRLVRAAITIPPGGRDLLSGAWIKLRGEFGDAGSPVLAFRLACNLLDLRAEESQSIGVAEDAANWQDNIVSKGVMSHHPARPSGVLFEMQFADTDPWAYPRLSLAPEVVPDNRYDGLALTLQVLEGTGTARVQLIEENGAAYVGDTGIDADRRDPQRAVVLFQDCKWGGHSRPDPDGRLLPENIRTVLVGINAQQQSHVKMVVTDMKWVRY